MPFAFVMIIVALVWLGGMVEPSVAIVVQPTDEQIRSALLRGKEAGKNHLSPDTLYPRFGEVGERRLSGFLMTKLASLAVMGAHMALRGLDPSSTEIAQVLQEPVMLITAMIWGDHPSFAAESYMVLRQGERVIKPVAVRFDGRASLDEQHHDQSLYKAKVVGAFRYDEFDPMTVTMITVVPGHGEAVHFVLDFSQIE